jgi:hypothetical protein
MFTLEHLAAHKSEILRIAELHGALNLGVFGSLARGEATGESDIDLLVDVAPKTSAWFPASLAVDLEALIGRRVHIVTRRALSPLIRDQVFEELVPFSDLN